MIKTHSVFYYIACSFLVNLFAPCFFVGFIAAQSDELFNSSIRTVVIDPGHGGKDPGCHGSHANEKTVCLQIGLALGRMIEKNYPSIQVIYTRTTDVFVELDERAKIANRNNADLFICIHANAAASSAHGAETYVLGLHRTEAQRKVMERENAIIHLEVDAQEKYKDFDLSPDAIIARNLQMSVILDQSINYAGKVQGEFKSIGRHDRGVKQAGFLVLYKTTMPSVLIETGFLTHQEEEKFLSNPENQQLMAQAMFKAFEKYKNELDQVQQASNQQAESGNASMEQNKVVFRVQIQTSSKRIPTSSQEFRGLTIYEYQQDGLYKYATGNFINDYQAASKLKDELRQKRFEYAFVIAFFNGERINLEKAIKLAENKP